MNVHIPEPGSGAFDGWIRDMSRLTGIDPTTTRLLVITIHQQAEARARRERESDERERRLGPDI